MENNKKAVVAMVITIVILVALFSGFWLTIFWREIPEVVLPTEDPVITQGVPGVNGPDLGGDILVEVTPKTVQAVIGTLNRPESYYRGITLEIFWGEGESAISTAQVWVDEGYTRVACVLVDGTVEHTIVGGGMRYRWYNNERKYYSVPAGEDDADLMQHIPTYEDVLALEQEEITAAGYEEKEGVPCVYVEVSQEELGYRERYWVSVSSGLLLAAETVKGEQVVLRISADSVEIPTRSNARFILPDGTELHSLTVS